MAKITLIYHIVYISDAQAGHTIVILCDMILELYDILVIFTKISPKCAHVDGEHVELTARARRERLLTAGEVVAEHPVLSFHLLDEFIVADDIVGEPKRR